MSKCGLVLLGGLVLAFAPALARADRGGTPKKKPPVTTVADDDDDDDADDAKAAGDDDDDDDRPAKRSKAKKPADDDDDDADADDDDDDDHDDRASRRSKWRKRTDTPTDDDAADDDDDGDDRDDAADDDDDDDDRPAKRAKAKKRRPAADEADDAAGDDDDDAGDDDATAGDDDDDDDAPRKPAKKRGHAKKRPADDTSDVMVDDDDAPIGGLRGAAPAAAAGPHVIDEVYIIPPKVIVAAELLGAAPIDSVNSDLFAMGGGAGLGVEYYLSPALALHASASFLYFRAGDAMETTTYAVGAAGPRLHLGSKLFGATTHHDAWLDAHATYGSSGGIRRPGFDVGGALEWEVSPALRVGPMVRWSFGSDPLDKNAQVVTAGLAIGVGGRTRQTIHVEGDADGDGLIDRLDECPGELPGDEPDRGHPGCPVRDGDHDGVVDDDDECADEPAGDRPDMDRLGCPLPPILDADSDGVPDGDDQCPELPGAERPGEPTNGCPLARVQDQKIEILEQIFFENDSATISEQSTPVLEAIGKVIGDLGDARVSIEGHTDEVGTDAYNMDLSKRRARAVAQWLIENAGVSATRLDVKGWGKRRPLVSGRGADTSKNRRVEFLILEEK